MTKLVFRKGDAFNGNWIAENYEITNKPTGGLSVWYTGGKDGVKHIADARYLDDAIRAAERHRERNGSGS